MAFITARSIVHSLVVSILLISTLAQSQVTNVSNVEATPIPGAGHDYLHMLDETVNPANGSLSVRIQVPIPKGRGLTLPFAFSYDSSGAWIPANLGNGSMTWNSWTYGKGGWIYTVPEVTLQTASRPGTLNGHEVACNYLTSYIFYDPQGSRHALHLATYVAGGNVGICQQLGNVNQILHSGDGYVSATLPDPSLGTNTPLTVQDADGTVYSFSAVTGGQAALATSVEDRNGNLMEYTQNGSTITVSDTLGRTVVTSTGFGSSGNTVNVSGLATHYSLSWGTAGTGSFGTGAILLSGACLTTWPNASAIPSSVSSISLPNGKSYRFTYDSTTGLLKQIFYPMGGWTRYTWQLNSQSELAYLTDSYGNPQGCTFRYGLPAISKREVSYDGTNVAEEQDFGYATPTWGVNGWTTKSTTVTTYDLVRGPNHQTAFTTSYTYVPFVIPPPPNVWSNVGTQVPVESQIVYKNWDGSNLRTVTKGWYDQYNLQSRQTALDNGLTSKTTYCYVGNNCLPTGVISQLKEKDEYDFGQTTTPSRQTITAYQGFGNSLGTIADKPCQTVTYDPSGAVAETDYFYDGGTALCGAAGTPSVTGKPNLTNHDETNYGPSSTLSRGNTTQKIEKCFNSSCSDAVTTYTYDETGQVLSMTDPCGNGTCSDMTGTNHITMYAYADSYTSGTPPGNTNAYLTTITYPATGGFSHIKNYSYGYEDGQLTVSKDESGNATNYKYNSPPSGCSFPDGLDRLSEIDYADLGTTTFCYNDAQYNASTPSPSITTTKKIASNVNYVSITAFDGIGHAVETILSSDPDGITYIATTYDGLGQPYTTSNPYRSTGDLTYGITKYTYDALGRILRVDEPDGSAVTTSYAGNTTTVNDEAFNQRTTQVDALGRLTAVWEAPNSSTYNYQSQYQYNALSNLICAVQKGTDTTAFTNCASASLTWRPRSFTYDSLSRVTSAKNPESGTIAYAYDANGNLQTKTSPSPNQPRTGTATVTTTYTYDALNRLTGKSYSDHYNGTLTPGVTYGYDGVDLSCPTPVGNAGSSATNGIGRRTAMCFAAGSKSWAFDPMGRIEQVGDRFIGLVAPYNSGNVFTIHGVPTISTGTNYRYDLMGNSQTVFYPQSSIPNYEFWNAFNAAGRISSAGDVYYNVLKNVTYTPHGALATALIGYSDATPSYKGTTISNTYNKRLQPVLMSATAPSGTSILNLTYNFNIGNGTSGSDNGNVIQIANGKDSNRTQNFSYDSLNRIQSTYTTGPNWGENYSIDPWANLTNIGSYTGKTGHETLNCSAANTNNQLNTCYTYDAAGNLIKNGATTYTYDVENRLIATAGMSYIYDGDGQRIEKCTQGPTPGTCASNATGTFYWSHVSGGPVAESDLGGNWTAIYGLIGRTIATRVDLPANVVHYYFQDHLHSTSIITDALGNIQKESDYYPYGGEIPISGSDSNRYKFTGKERDSESGLDMFGARYYGSSLGRFMTPDWAAKPIDVPYANFGNPQSLNLYSYVENNPTTSGDPDGHGDWYDLSGRRLGTDGVPDGRVIIQNASAVSYSSDHSLVDVAGSGIPMYDISGHVGNAIQASVDRTLGRTDSDTQGGFHEEGFTVDSGGVHNAAPGPAYQPGADEAHINLTVTSDTTIVEHTHPAGTTDPSVVMGGTHFNQEPSTMHNGKPGDIQNVNKDNQVAPGATHIVAGAGDSTVRFYNQNGTQAKVPLNAFPKCQNNGNGCH